MEKFEKRTISENFDVTIDNAPKFENWTCQKVENCHTNGLSTYYHYIHDSGVISVVVRQSDHYARFEIEEKGLYIQNNNVLFPAKFSVKTFSIFDDLKWINNKSKNELIERFCNID